MLAKQGHKETAIEHLAMAIERAPDIAGLLPSFPEFTTLLTDPRLNRD